MTTQELRIGNLLTSKSWKGAHSIGGIVKHTKESFTLTMNGYEHKYEEGKYFDLEPIPLDESWLIKAGFENNSYSVFSRKISEYAWLSISFKDYACSMICENPDIADHDTNAPCKYVHQLQNLYHALTGTELTLNN